MTDDRPVLDQVNVVVRDMDAAVAFYRRLGVEIADTAPQWDAAPPVGRPARRRHRTSTSTPPRSRRSGTRAGPPARAAR